MKHLKKNRLKWRFLVIIVPALFLLVGTVSIIWYFVEWKSNDTEVVIVIAMIAGAALTYFFQFVYKHIIIKYLDPEFEHCVQEVTNYDKGIKGEESVVQELRRLWPSDEYHIIQSVKIGNHGDADIVVVSPKGIFAIEVKNWSSSIRVESEEVSYYNNDNKKWFSSEKNPFKQVKGQAYNIQQFLENKMIPCKFVEPIVVFTGGELEKCTNTTTSVAHIDNIGTILNKILERDDIYTLKACNQIAKLLQQRVDM